MVIVLIGVTGSGKTTVGKQLAHQLGWNFSDGDDFHSGANIARMRAGIPLNDEDRRPWLDRLSQLISEKMAAGENLVLACSALKASYRQRLRVNSDVRFVYLKADFALIAKRLAARHGHFMNPALLKSQWNDLEEPAANEAITVEAASAPAEVVRSIETAFRKGPHSQ